jgi:hypothetical protein
MRDRVGKHLLFAVGGAAALAANVPVGCSAAAPAPSASAALVADPSPDAAAPPGCPPAAAVHGRVEIVRPVVETLRSHGVRPPQAGGRCAERAIRASLARAGDRGMYRLRIVDGYGRSSERRSVDAATAASLIESWAMGEDTQMLASRAAPAAPGRTSPEGAARLPAAATEPPPLDGPATAVAPAGVEGEGASPGVRVIAALETQTDLDGNRLHGGSVTACAHVGRVCVGGRLRRGRGSDATTVPDTDINRSGVDLLAVIALPLGAGRFSLTPLAGVGAGWTRATFLPDPITIRRDDGFLRGEVAVLGGLTVVRHFSLLMELGASFGARTSTDPVNELAVVLPPPAGFNLRGALGGQLAF